MFAFGSEAVVSIAPKFMTASSLEAEQNQGHILVVATTANGQERSFIWPECTCDVGFTPSLHSSDPAYLSGPLFFTAYFFQQYGARTIFCQSVIGIVNRTVFHRQTTTTNATR